MKKNGLGWLAAVGIAALSGCAGSSEPAESVTSSESAMEIAIDEPAGGGDGCDDKRAACNNWCYSNTSTVDTRGACYDGCYQKYLDCRGRPLAD